MRRGTAAREARPVLPRLAAVLAVLVAAAALLVPAAAASATLGGPGGRAGVDVVPGAAAHDPQRPPRVSAGLRVQPTALAPVPYALAPSAAVAVAGVLGVGLLVVAARSRRGGRALGAVCGRGPPRGRLPAL
jgi:hypothetical protein